jgi:hypothetical protein
VSGTFSVNQDAQQLLDTFVLTSMTLLDIILFPFSMIIFIAELWSGYAVIGWAGDRSVVERSKSPGPYWFAIVVQAICWICISALWIYARNFSRA